MKFALKANGILTVLDLYEAKGFSDMFKNLEAVPLHAFLKLKNNGRIGETREVREAWAKHGNDPIIEYRRFVELARICFRGDHQKHLLWRYSIVWRKQI